MLIKDEIDEQEAFSLQAMKYNRKSPYRNVSNDFNFFEFIILTLQKRQRISYEQLIVATFSEDGDVENFIQMLEDNTFADENSVYNFVRETYGTTNKPKTVLRDYPDVVLRLLLITGFVSIQFKGKLLIFPNANKIDYMNDLLAIPIELTEEEKQTANLHFRKLETFNDKLLQVVYKHRQTNVNLDKFDYTQKVTEIIKLYELKEENLVEGINFIGSSRNIIPAFKYIAEPLKLEFYISLLLVFKYGESLGINPNYKADHFGMPISHAAGNKGDIEVYAKDFYWLIEVTLIRNKAQQLNNETTSVIRHFIESKDNFLLKFLSFVAPIIHADTKNYYDYSIVQQRTDKKNLYIKPYSVEEFINITVSKRNLEDMKSYTKQVIEDFKKNLED
jgi:hypothetical protein